jgi:hypothetical protein
MPFMVQVKAQTTYLRLTLCAGTGAEGYGPAAAGMQGIEVGDAINPKHHGLAVDHAPSAPKGGAVLGTIRRTAQHRLA